MGTKDNNRYKVNEDALAMYHVTQQDYLNWCEMVKKPPYSNATKQDFFKRLREGRLIRDNSGKLIRKYRRK